MRTSYTQSKRATVSTKPLQTMWRGLLAAAAAVLLALVGTQSTNAQSTLTVCADGCTHTTIQAAINAAAAGDTIQVAAGTYAELVTINKQLTLLGPNASKVGNAPDRVDEATIRFPAGATNGSSLVSVSQDIHNVTIAGFNF
ncbi:MAG: hypothetical protein ACKO4U_03130, partial [Caldilinea sp.]